MSGDEAYEPGDPKRADWLAEVEDGAERMQEARRCGDEALAGIRARSAAATPGPWAWFGNTDVHNVYLATQHWGRHYVMGFRRWGMQGAQPEFWNRPDPDVIKGSLGPDSHHTTAAESPIYEVAPDALSAHDRRVYRRDLVGIRNADATFIAHSREDVDYLLGEVDRLRAILGEAS